MKLVDLNPWWVGSGGDGVTGPNGQPVPRREKVGIGLDCPCGCGEALYIPFLNPLDGGPALEPIGRPAWQRTGDTFESLTLVPSILRVTWTDTRGESHGCGWHGWIQNGQIVNC